eukprot:TRINITY_DN2896_c0_g1_i3.p2 TRINITY_DN2896_c0_g1~~TRINITY_DN2896_c0_g1_i3.p2  ORF type:complete len:188 (+),score=44.60 TRINITY_DN2896_c0_g1_i3:637-1200(+)
MNPRVIDSAQKDTGFLTLLYDITQNYLAQKHKLILNEKYSIPKLKYKGKGVEFQRVKGKKAPKIQELDSDEISEATPDLARNLTQPAERTQRPDWRLFLGFTEDTEEEFDGLNFDEARIQRLIIEIDLPLLVTGHNAKVVLSEEELFFRNGKMYELILKLPLLVRKETGKGIFYTQTRKLRIEMQVK